MSRPSDREAARRKTASAHVRSAAPRADVRPHLDFYKTPPQAPLALLGVEKFRPCEVLWEPACGDGAISRVLKEHGCTVVSTDLAARGYGRTGVDFLTYRPRFEFDAVVTNPPFTHIGQFAARCRELEVERFFLIGRLLWLEGYWLTAEKKERRRDFFRSAGLARVHVFSPRINIAPERYEPRVAGRGGMVSFAWYAFERGYRGAPRIGWLDVTELD